ncbi:MAG: arginase [Planctomycetes bacterium]|nr:arginase [Planctomycetota bacterium]
MAKKSGKSQEKQAVAAPGSGRRVDVLGVPLDHGAGRRGVSMGPSALRIARLHDALKRIGYVVNDLGDVDVTIPETVAPGDPQAKYLSIVAPACAEVARCVDRSLCEGAFPLVIGGDHSIAIGTISGVAIHLRRSAQNAGPPPLGVIWFDAHGDINTPETTPSGNIHGMPVACLLGEGPESLTGIGFPGAKVSPGCFVQVGLRDIDEVEKARLHKSGIHTYTMEDIDRRRLPEVVEEAIRIATTGCAHLHVSFDIDVLDPSVAPGTGTAKIGGFTYREAHMALEMVARSGMLRSFELVEVNPVLDERNRTAEVGVGLIASALGKRIL